MKPVNQHLSVMPANINITVQEFIKFTKYKKVAILIKFVYTVIQSYSKDTNYM